MVKQSTEQNVIGRQMTQPSRTLNTEAVTKEFARQISDDYHSSATLAVFIDGKPVMDITRGALHAKPLFRVFSVGKPFAAAILWRQKARGYFDWDTAIAEYWPEFGTRGKSSITVEQVLAHTAGLSDHSHIPPTDYNDWGRIISHIEDMTPQTKPGSTVSYHAHTFGWIVGEFASRVSGLSFDEVFKREVTLPLGLKNTSYTLEPEEFGRVVPLEIGSDWDDKEIATNMDLILRAQVSIPAGSMITTANDVAKFYAAISSNGLINGVRWLPEEVISEVTSLKAEGLDGASGAYSRVGLGVRLPSDPPNQYASSNNSDTIGHSGLGTCTSWASLIKNVSVAYVTNRFQTDIKNDYRLHEMSKTIRASISTT
ncbi:MAG: serine hydrolase domain-containing protein [Chloroflexota bacterium]|nr:serine hydrolase domain-containing protein [Chloroflexota bacterium]